MSSLALPSVPLGLIAAFERDAPARKFSASQRPGVAPRSFNRVDVDRARRRVTKWSATAAGKIAQEIAFYEDLPPSLRRHFPALLAHGTRDGGRFYTMALVEGAALSTRMVETAQPRCAGFDFERAINVVLDVHQGAFRSYRAAPMDGQALAAFYWDKTAERLARAMLSRPWLADWLTRDTVRIDGTARLGWPRLAAAVKSALVQASAGVQGGFVHGDLCLSNILWSDVRSEPVFVDPRGDFLGSVNWGDVRYDLAKLLHSSHGRYDLVTHDLFELTDEGEGRAGLTFEPAALARARRVATITLRALSARMSADERRHVMLLEALLFMSMLPLHDDAPRRQQAFAVIGLELLNRWFEGAADAPLH